VGKRKPAPSCPCGGGLLADCCGPLLDGSATAETAEQLMRSRYSAYALDRHDYLLASWHPRTRPATLEPEPAVKWIGLAVLAARMTGESRAEVEFVARYRIAGKAHRLHELSRFERVDGRWLYLDGDVGEA